MLGRDKEIAKSLEACPACPRRWVKGEQRLLKTCETREKNVKVSKMYITICGGVSVCLCQGSGPVGR